MLVSSIQPSFWHYDHFQTPGVIVTTLASCRMDPLQEHVRVAGTIKHLLTRLSGLLIAYAPLAVAVAVILGIALKLGASAAGTYFKAILRCCTIAGSEVRLSGIRMYEAAASRCC